MKKFIFGFAGILLGVVTPEVAAAATPAPIFSEVIDNHFQISWEGVDELTEGNTTGAYIKNVDTDDIYDMLFLEDYLYSKANLRISGKYLDVNLTNNYPDLPGGTYRLYIPGGYVKFNGTSETNKAIDGHEFNYKVAWSEGPTTCAGPSDEGIVTITWDDASSVDYNPDYEDDIFSTGVFIYDAYETIVEVPYPGNISFSQNVMTVDLNGLGLPTGECRLTVPLQFVVVTVDGETGLNTQEVTYRFNYVAPDEPGSSVGAVVLDKPEIRYYDLQGHRLRAPLQGSPYIRMENGNAVKMLDRR